MKYRLNRFQRHALSAAVALSLAGAAHAQLSTATIKGQVASAQAGAVVTAVNQANGNTYRATLLADGSYVLTGLAPGVYEIRIGAVKSQPITVQVGETASVDLTANTQQLERVVVAGSSARQGVKDSQLGTNVSQRMIAALPQTTRNFLSSADLAPGVAFSTDQSGNTKIQGGAQNFDHVNVFIDGVGQKNNILRGGLSGQDSSRGNPFPQSAISEFKVLSQNYKAEFEQVSSAAITAITKSGTNELHGEAYVDRTGTNWRQKNPFEKEREAAGVALPPSSKKEYGFSLGGPIVRDQAHFFFAYDGKSIDDSRQIVPRNVNMLPTGKGIVPTIAGFQGSQVDNFKEHLLFGKIDAQLDDEQRISVSLRVRREADHSPESRDLSAPGNDVERKNDETRFDIKHEWARGGWFSEARVGYEDYVWNPRSAASSAFIKYKVSPAGQNALSNSQDVLFTGGSPNAQKRGQRGSFISEDLTYTGISGHVLKGGAKFKAMKYDLSGTAFGVDTVETIIDNVTGLAYYNGTACTGTNITNGGNNSDQCFIRRAIPGAAASFKNNQMGLYLQDDWAVTKQFELNIGARYDYESNMLNNSYVTPAARVAALKKLDVPRYGFTPAAGQTYAQSLAKGGVNIDDFISTGSSRQAFKGGLAPRLGASYDLFGNRESVIFGGWGRSYDRTMANHALDELQKNEQAGGEIWMIKNKFKMPFADQLTVGLRQGMGEWNAEFALSSVKAKNQFVWFGGNRDANGGWANQSPIDPLWGGPDGYGTLILGDFVGETKTDSVLVKFEKPYTVASGWAMNVAYTYSNAKTTSKEWNNDIFDWTYGRATHGWNPSTLVDKQRLVVAGVTDKLLPWGMSLSGKATWASGMPRRITSCAAGWDKCVSVEGDATAFKQFDLGLSKEFAVIGHKLGLRLDALNLFNAKNYGGFDDWGGGPVGAGGTKNAVGGDNLNLGKPNSMRGDMRTYRLVASVKF
ncbi:TonB-dependent receptor [Paucibacter sp. JuS9]|uniref:TonB-dependent receptor domain-containing protein n=1 Tax=Paucibacter sp. JuS9 TaxID=3228748 RepID=UPI0037572AE3